TVARRPASDRHATVSSAEKERPVIVAVAAVHVVQVTLYEVIRMVGVRHRLVPTAGTMVMRCIMPGALVIGRAGVRVRVAHRNRVFLDLRTILMVQMAVVQVILMPVMLDEGVSAVGPVYVGMGRLRMLGLRL